MSGFELSVSGINVTVGLLGQCYIADVKVNGKTVTPVGYNSGSSLTVTSITLSTGTDSNTSATPTPKPAATATPKPSTSSITSYAMEAKSFSDASRYCVKLTTSVTVGDVKVNGKNVTPVGYNSGATLATSTVTGLGSGETVTPTPKPVATATPTPKPTATPTPKPTATPTPKPTATSTPTATPTPTISTNISNPSKAYAMEPKEGTGVTESSRWRVRLYDQIVTGDIISFWVKPSVIENADMYARDGVKATYLDAQGNSLGKNVYSGAHITDYAISEFNGWYYIQCMATGDSVSFELSVDATNTVAGVMGQCYIRRSTEFASG